MTAILCTTEKPWGIHDTLRDHQCSRCGWSVPDAGPKASEPAVAPWTVISGGLDAPLQAAA